jgi:superfamily I DNA and RNA helicase
MPEGVGLAAKNTIYTAITRSSYRVHLFGSKESIDACIQKNLPEFHDTFIKHLDNAIEEDKIKEQANEKETDYLSSDDDDLPFE